MHISQPQVMVNAPNPWKPVHDGLFLGPGSLLPAFLPAEPLDLLQVPPYLHPSTPWQAGNMSDIPVIIGHTKDEGLYAVTDMAARTPTVAHLVLNNWEHGKGPSYIFGRSVKPSG